MLVFIDESGSPGTKQGPGSTSLFTIAAVVFDCGEDATEAEHRIGELRRELRLPSAFEFHFNDAKAATRMAFFKTIAPVRFAYFAACIDKTSTRVITLGNALGFYQHACHLALAELAPYLEHAVVTVDATGGRLFRQTLRTHLLRLANGQSGTKLIRAVRFEDSAASSLVQMADMVSGAIHRSYSTKPDAHAYRNLIVQREMLRVLWR